VFHEGASGYVAHSRTFHSHLAQAGFPLELNPIMRVRYNAWDHLRTCCAWLRLPEPLQRPFGTEEVCAPTFSTRWREVGAEQDSLLSKLGELRRPIELIRFLDTSVGGFWKQVAAEYEELHGRLEGLKEAIETLRNERFELYDQVRELKRERGDRERAKGEQFRARIFEREPDAEDLAERDRLTAAVDETIGAIATTENEIHRLLRAQTEVVTTPEVQEAHARRREIEAEAELKRLRLIRHAIIASKGLRNANHRPSAWWFPLLCPDGLWFRATVEEAECYLEPLSG